jgi:hypothetical protein
MADVKISGLPASTTPLAGTEVLPIVQSTTTKQVSVANLTAGRAVAALSVVTPTLQAEAGSAGGTIKNGSGVAQMQWGSGGGSNLSLEVATNINPANAAVNISPTGTGTVAISPAGALTINPTAASTINNASIGVTTPLAGKFTTLEATGVATMSAGTVSDPAITTTGDTNTGIFFPAADTIAFAEGGAEVMRINADAQIVAAAGTALLPVITTTGDVNTGIYFPAADTIAFTEGGVESMRLNSSGNQLVGTTTNPGIARHATAFSTNYWQYGASTTGSSIFWVLNAANTGVSLTDGNTSWAAQSDERTKDIIEPIGDALSKVNSLRAVIGKYKTDEEGTRRSFLIAQDVKAVLPEVVDTDTDAQGTMSIRYTEVIPLLVASIKELSSQVAELQAKLKSA